MSAIGSFNIVRTVEIALTEWISLFCVNVRFIIKNKQNNFKGNMGDLLVI